jgi:hypothetical protein
MARCNWFDGTGKAYFENVRQLRIEEINKYWADGVIDDEELARQKQAVMDQLKAIEHLIDDQLHEKLTSAFVDWALLDVMLSHRRTAQQG